jgi:hypothetical protein
MAPSEWKSGDSSANSEEWTLDKLKAHMLKVSEGIFKTPTEIRGVVDFPVWDFIDVVYFVYPVLHGEIGLANVAVDAFFDVLDDKIEVMTVAEKTARSQVVFADIAFDSCKDRLAEWSTSGPIDLAGFQIARTDVNAALRQRGLSEEQKSRLVIDKQDVEDNIKLLMDQRKALEEDLKLKRSHFSAAKKNLTALRAKKCKMDRPVRAEIQNMLENHEITSAAYHGGDLNGVCC